MPSKLHVTVWKGKSHTLGRCIGNVDTIFVCFVSMGNFCLVQVHVQTINFRLFGLKEFADDNFECNENSRKFLKQIENTGKKRNCFPGAISPFPMEFSKRLVLQTQTRACVGILGLMI